MTRTCGSVWIFLATAGCADLAPIEHEVCGNRIVEPENGEECDSYPVGACGEPNTNHQCRFICSPGAVDEGCPDGFGCGADGVCRRGSNAYEAGSFVDRQVTTRLVTGDFDADGRRDLVTVGDEGTFAHLFESAGDPLSVLVTRRSTPPLAVNLELRSGRRQDDIMAVDTRTPDAYGIVIYGEFEDKSIAPLFGKITPFGSDSAMVAAAIQTTLEMPPSGPDSFVMSVSAGGKPFLVSSAGNLLNLPSAAPVVPPMLVGLLDEDRVRSPCDEIGIVFQGSSEIWFVPSCVQSGDKLAWNADANNDPIATLPVLRQKNGATLDGAVLGDIDSDGHLDVVAWTESSMGCATLYRAYGLGDGTFHSSPGAPRSPGDGVLDVFGPGEVMTGHECVRDHSPLVVKDLDRDGVAEVVTRDGVFSSGSVVIDAAHAGGSWETVSVGDFDADGKWDVMVSAAGYRGLALFSGVGRDGIRRRTNISTDGFPAAAVVGDYDGDGADDVAFVDRLGKPDGNPLAVAFGEPRGMPERAKRIGLGVLETTRLTPVRLGSSLAARDVVSGLIVVQSPDLLTAMPGDPGRELIAPLDFDGVYGVEDTELQRPVPGRFSDQGQPGLASLCKGSDKVDRLTLELMVTNGSDLIYRIFPVLDSSPNGIPNHDGYKFASYPTMVPIDLDWDGVDEIAIVSNARGAAPDEPSIGVPGITMGQIVLGRRGTADAQANFVFSDPFLVGESFGVDELHPDQRFFVDDRSAIAFDIDGHGRKDLFTFGKLGNKTMFALYMRTGSQTIDPTRRVIFHSDSPVFDVATVFAPVLRVATGRARIALLTPDGAYLAELDVPSATVTVEPEPLVRGPVTDVAAGDFDADGVIDLAVASPDGARVFRGVPVVR